MYCIQIRPPNLPRNKRTYNIPNDALLVDGKRVRGYSNCILSKLVDLLTKSAAKLCVHSEGTPSVPLNSAASCLIHVDVYEMTLSRRQCSIAASSCLIHIDMSKTGRVQGAGCSITAASCLVHIGVYEGPQELVVGLTRGKTKAAAFHPTGSYGCGRCSGLTELMSTPKARRGKG
jgi:hypothetical protein